MKRYPEMTYREVTAIAAEKGDQGYIKDWARENFYVPDGFDYDMKKAARREYVNKLFRGEGFDHDTPGHVVARQFMEEMDANREQYTAA